MASSPALIPEVIHQPSNVIDLVDGKRRLTKTEARTLTNEIRGSANRLWILVSVAYDRGAHYALGYETWKDYVTIELGLSESRSYQLIDLGKVMHALSDATGMDVADIDPVPARMVQKVKHAVPQLRDAVRDFIKDNPQYDAGEVIEAALRAVVPAQPKSSPADEDVSRGGGVICPACQGGGDLGTGRNAKRLGRDLEEWLTGYFG